MAATARGVSSSRYGPTIWTPTGRFSRVRAGRRHGGRQVGDEREGRPEERVEHHGPLRPVDGPGPPAHRRPVVRERRQGQYGCEQHVVVLKELEPLALQLQAPLVHGQPAGERTAHRGGDLLAVRQRPQHLRHAPPHFPGRVLAHVGIHELQVQAEVLVEVDVRHGVPVHPRAALGERLRRGLEQCTDLGVHRVAGPLEARGHAQLRHVRRPRGGQLHLPRDRFLGRRSHQEPERVPHVGGGDAHRPDHPEVLLADLLLPVHYVALRDDPVTRLVAEHAVEVGRDPDGPADVPAELQRRHAGRQRGARPSGGASAGARRIPGIAGRTVQFVEALPVPAGIGRVGLAEHDGPGVDVPLHRVRVARGNVVPVLRHPVGADDTLREVGVLDGQRHAVQRPQVLAPPRRAVGLRRAFARPVRVELHDGVDLRVEPLHPLEKALQHAARSQGAPLDVLRQGEGGPIQDVAHATPSAAISSSSFPRSGASSQAASNELRASRTSSEAPRPRASATAT